MRPEALVRRIEGWVFAPVDARRLAAIRIGLCSLLVLRLASADYRVVAGQPAALFEPVFYLKLLDRMPSSGVATTLQACGIAAALLAAAGLALSATLPLAVACSLFLNGMVNSSGRVIVGDAMPTLCLLLLVAGVGAAGEKWSLRGPLRRAFGALRRRPAQTSPCASRRSPVGERYGWPVRTAMVAIALGYFFAGFQKWRYSGLPWVTSDNLRWILYASSDSQAHPNGVALFIADRPTLTHLFAAGSLLLETCFPLILFIPRLRWLLVPGAVAMHTGIRLALGLDYSAQWLTVVIVFVNWPVLVAWLQRVTAHRLTLRGAHG
jgi:hypothetical protein